VIIDVPVYIELDVTLSLKQPGHVVQVNKGSTLSSLYTTTTAQVKAIDKTSFVCRVVVLS
jgi:hypothetical protein